MQKTQGLTLDIFRLLADKTANTVIYLLVFCSGLSGLIYEISWIRQAALGFGSSALALSTVLAVFFLGLGVGSFWFGRIALSLKQPLLVCAIIELLLALNGVFSQSAFAWAEAVFGTIYRDLNPGSGQITLIRACLVTLVLLPPTILMGGTLPLFCRQLIRVNNTIASKLSLIYGLNTLGAAFGCLLTGFILLPDIGLVGSLKVAVFVNIFVGLGFLQLNARERVQKTKPIVALQSQLSSKHHFSIVWPGILFFMIGVTALANELIWARFLIHFIRNSVYTYTIALSVVLVGAGLGSLWQGKHFDRLQNPRQLLIFFAVLQAGSALLVQLLTHLPTGFWQAMHSMGILAFAILMMPVAIISGICFPLLNRMVLWHSRLAPGVVGTMTALNILGCIFGSVLTGFFLLPAYGLDISILLVTTWGMMTALLAIGVATGLDAKDIKNAPVLSGAMGLMLGVWCLLLVFPPTVIPSDYIGNNEVLMDYAEGYNSNLAVTKRNGEKTLLIDGLWQGVVHKNYQIMVAHTPMLIYPEAENILVVGLGTGTTASRFLYYDIKQLHVVDIEPRLFEFTQRNFASEWMKDSRVKLFSEDGRNFIKHSANRYDLISVEIGQLDRPGVGVFYTQSFYQEARERLREGGMISQFVPLKFLRPVEFVAILKTFLNVFPNASLWYNTDELLLLGYKDSVRKLSQQRFMQITADSRIRSDINMYYWGGARYNLRDFPTFLANFLASGVELARLANSLDTEVYTDDRLQLSYSMSDYQRSDQRAIALVPLIQKNLTPISAAVETAATDVRSLEIAEHVRNYNVADIAASDIVGMLNITTNSPLAVEEVLTEANRALKWNPLNIYAQAKRRQAMLDLAEKRKLAYPTE